MLDQFGRRHTYLRLSLTERCNLRCKYCMPAQGIALKPRAQILSFEELERLARVFAGLGVRKLRLTGGEPTVRAGVVELVRRLSGVAGIEQLALTTNGVLLDGLARPLHKAGLGLLNVSLDTLNRARFAQLTGRDLLPAVQRGIDRALNAGFSPLKINVVVMAGVNDGEVLDFVELARARPLGVRFIEYMPFRDNGWSEAGYLPLGEVHARIAARYELLPLAGSAGPGGVAKSYRGPGFQGTLSYITPLSDAFCGRCDRLRLSCDGWLKTCLFSPPAVNLRDTLRGGADDEALARLIRAALVHKPQAHLPAGQLQSTARQAMAEIGG